MIEWGSQILKVGPKIDFNAKNPDQVTAENGTDIETQKNQFIEELEDTDFTIQSYVVVSEDIALRYLESTDIAIVTLDELTTMLSGNRVH